MAKNRKTPDMNLPVWFDGLLIGMEGANLKNMQRICGGDPAGKMHRLLDYTDRPGDVADPWYTGDFEATWRDVSTGCQGLLASIQNKNV